MRKIAIIPVLFTTLSGCGSLGSDAPSTNMKAGMWLETQDVQLRSATGSGSSTVDAAERAKLDKALSGLNKALGGLSQVVAAGTRICVDDEIQTHISVVGGPDPGSQCAGKTVVKTPNGYRIGMVCTRSGVKGTIAIVVQGDMAKAFTSDVSVTANNSKVATSVTGNSHHSFHYLGPCSSDMTPGDLEIAGLPKSRMENGYAVVVK